MNHNTQQIATSKTTLIQQLLTADVAIVLGAVLGLGLAFRSPNPDMLGIALSTGIGALVGLAFSRILRQFSLRIRVIAIIVFVLMALPLLGAIVYSAG
ncbi:hypothetical protein NG895_28035 [Aeoliella sp. ICT_H6.2]|uniref:Uncharacterized protein n=1 Tax=Aeoliella straminimaris TaxID=2954799 RepID=A0A9X2JJM5_9BACT|nr:hypothetical protein [Aeoliella straminimaris]MCO6047772.1 hypothetical protein [Aeoliella straminimaris]